MNNIVLVAVLAVAGAPVIHVGYIVLAEHLLQRLPEKRQRTLRPWLWLAPALFFLTTFLFYPAVNTLSLSFLDAGSDRFVGLQNCLFTLTDREMLVAFRNTLQFVAAHTPSTETAPASRAPRSGARAAGLRIRK